MIELVKLVVVAIWGTALGMVFFGGLWWTIRRGLQSDFAAFWFLGSLLIRTAIVLAGFYMVAQGNWENIAACAVGFGVARLTITRYLHWPKGDACI